jgi:protein-S-isoprenylcysteine O-methyltransferase Ste14
MPLPRALSQGILSAAILTSTIGTYIALSPPNPSTTATETSPTVHSDSLNSLGLTNSHIAKIALLQLFPFALHTSILAWRYPSDNIPPYLLGHGLANAFNFKLLTWTPSTAIPLLLIFLFGVPLRLIAYATLAHDFTFFLAPPNHLITTGIYAYVQHPSYVGLVILLLSNIVLLGRTDGVASCWIPPHWYTVVRKLVKWVWPVGVGILGMAVWTRVREEELMLRGAFGKEWEAWHERTARFVPGVF